MRFLSVGLLFILSSYLFGQSGTLKGRVAEKINNEPIPFANIFIPELSVGVSSDFEGNYSIENIKQ